MKRKYTLEELNKMVEDVGENGWLDLRSLTSIPEGFNPTVGGSLYLSSLTSIPEGFNPTVGGWLDLSSALLRKVNVKHLAEGDYIEGKYLYADGILTHVKRKKKIGDYIYYVGKIPNQNVISDGENFAHCKSFKDGVCDLNFKKASDRGADQYKELTLESKVSYEDARTMYRIITGACAAGTQHFIDGLAEEDIKDEYTVAEIIEMTKGQYGHGTFKDFFDRRDK